MDPDLSQLLRDFPFEPGRVNARLVRSDRGRSFLQIRVELGLLQMECHGRPDGAPSVLEALRGSSGPIDAASTAALRLELVQYQQRAVAYLSVGEPERALADADAVLEGTEVMLRRGPSAERDWADGARFSVLVLRTRCSVAGMVARGRARDAGRAIDAGLSLLHEAAERIGIAEGFDSLSDVVALRALRDTLVPQLPPAQRSELEARLREAILSENYELAAILRDELRML